MLVKDIIQLDQTNSPHRRQPGGVPTGRPSGGGSRRRLSGSMDGRVWIVIAALGCVAALFVPWLRLDGHTGSLSGVGLMSYALQGNDRTVMWQISPVATAALGDGSLRHCRGSDRDGVERAAGKVPSGRAVRDVCRRAGAVEVHAAGPGRAHVRPGRLRGARSGTGHVVGGDPGGDGHRLQGRAAATRGWWHGREILATLSTICVIDRDLLLFYDSVIP